MAQVLVRVEVELLMGAERVQEAERQAAEVEACVKRKIATANSRAQVAEARTLEGEPLHDALAAVPLRRVA